MARQATKHPGEWEGFPPTAWGPGLWLLLHTTAAAYPEVPTPEDKKHHMAFLRSLAHVLPCDGCRKGMLALTTAGPLKLTACVLRDKFAFFKWTVDLHNAVNAKVGKRVSNDWVAWYRHYTNLRR